MKILMVTEDLPDTQVGGLGKHVVTLSNKLIDTGHEVEILGRSDRDYVSFAAEIGFRGRFIPGFDFPWAGWKEEKLGFFNPLKRPVLAKRIANAINALVDRFDVIHYHGHLPMVGLYVNRRANFVQTRHDQGSECLTHFRFRNNQICDELAPRKCASCAHPQPGMLRTFVSTIAVSSYRRLTAETFCSRKTIFVSDFLRRQFLRAVPEANLKRSEVVHNFVDFARLARLVGHDLVGEPGSVLLAGRMDRAKGFSAFLEEATGRIPEGVTLHLVGDGPDRTELERRYSNSRVRFHGWQSYAEVIRLTARSHLCVVPSVLQESFGTTVLEALSLGKCCLALAQGGTPEMMPLARYPGQLQLANTMQELVDLTIAQALSPVRNVSIPSTFSADISVVLPKILEVYARP